MILQKLRSELGVRAPPPRIQGRQLTDTCISTPQHQSKGHQSSGWFLLTIPWPREALLHRVYRSTPFWVFKTLSRAPDTLTWYCSYLTPQIVLTVNIFPQTMPTHCTLTYKPSSKVTHIWSKLPGWVWKHTETYFIAAFSSCVTLCIFSRKLVFT